MTREVRDRGADRVDAKKVTMVPVCLGQIKQAHSNTRNTQKRHVQGQ